MKPIYRHSYVKQYRTVHVGERCPIEINHLGDDELEIVLQALKSLLYIEHPVYGHL